MKRIVSIVIGVACLAGAQAWAGEPDYKGPWIVNGAGVSAMGRDVRWVADLVIDGAGGTWQSRATNRDNPCTGRKFPVSVSAASDDTLAFTIMGSEVLRGCPDTLIELKRADAGTLKGSVKAETGSFDLVVTRP